MDALAQLKEALSERYDIKREIGAGGMATVFLAQDLRHDRPVALKLLNPELGAVLGPERFLAEIRVTANLQHPNLLPLFDSGASDGLLYYVMPFVDGETLRARLDREKQLPVDEAIRITVAVANALDYAHSHGVIHRDLKPENILMQSGQPVIADFGIALAVSNAGGNRITQTGLSLGTPQYMSPEQATGDRVIDGRSDIYSLGAVAYEMFTGEAPHTGNTSQAIIARMLTEKPRPMRTSRPTIPDHVEFAVQHALEKLPADRFSTAHELAQAMHGHATAGTTGLYSFGQTGARASALTSWKSRLRDPLTIGLAALAVAALGFAFTREAAPVTPGSVVRFILATPDSLSAVTNFPWPAAISPDGSTVVYSARNSPLLYGVRTDQLDPHPIPGTEGGSQVHFSPDGEYIAFESGGKLRKVKLDGSAPIAVTDASSDNGADWTVRDEIILGSEGTKRGLSSVSASGGDLVEFVKPDKAKREQDYVWPIAAPDGKVAAFVIWYGSLASSKLATVSIGGTDVTELGVKGVRPLAILGRTLVYVQSDGAVMALKLNGSYRKADGKPIPVLDPVIVNAGLNGNSSIFVSQQGALVTAKGGANSRLAWIKEDGAASPVSQEVKVFTTPRLSPDGERLAVTVTDQGKTDIWMHDFANGTLSRLTTIDNATGASWTRDGSKLFFVGVGGEHGFAIWSQNTDGGSVAEKVIDTEGPAPTVSVAPDGKSLVYVAYAENAWRVFRVPLDSAVKSRPYLSSTFNQTSAVISPDGRWVAIVTDQSGRNEVFIRSYPIPNAQVQISNQGGSEPLWSPDGSAIYYRAVPGSALIRARLGASPSTRVIARDTAVKDMSSIRAADLTAGYDVARDGRIIGRLANSNSFQIVVVPNWRIEMEKRLARATKR
ncbi:MAG TPA: protein kinase [Gemmatimonadaceae bacterium]|nr:protein kinase [Gemmatimonadaceae bacterium]